MNKFFSLILILLLLAAPALAYDYFSQEGFRGDTGIFVSGFIPTAYSQGIGAPAQMPLVADLDNDGLNEIIIIDGGTFRVFRNNTLISLDTASTGFTDHYSNFIAFDIDGDGLKELIIASETGKREIFIGDFNNSQFTKTRKFNWNMTGALTPVQQSTDPEANENEAALNCRAVNDCAMVITQSVNIQSHNNLTAIHFNQTNATSHSRIQDTTDPSSSLTCLPNIVKELAIGDYDNDGNIEYVIDARSVGVPTVSLNEPRLWVIWFDASSSGISVEASDSYNDIYESPASTDTVCYDQGVNDNSRLSSVTLHSFLGGNEKQAAIAYMTTSSKFIVRVWDSSGNNIDRYPDVDDVEGQLISNIVVGKFYASSSGNNDFCAFGFDETTGVFGEIQAMCGTLAASEGQSDKIYSFDLEDISNTATLFNITISSEEDYYRFNSLMWTADHSNAKLDQCNFLVCGIGTPANVDELITPYGIFELTHDSGGIGGCAIGGNCALSELWQNIYSLDGGLISYDIQDNGKDDLLYMTSGGLFYLDDRTLDNPGYISKVDFNPCPIGTVLGVNTSMSIAVTVKDPDQTAKVGARAIVYEGDINEQDSGWSINVTSGNPLSFNFQINKTITNGQIEIYGRDVGNPDSFDTKTYAFTAADTGLKFDESTCSESFESPLTAAGNASVLNASNSAALQVDVNDNAVTNVVVQLAGFSGLGGMGILLLALIITDLFILIGTNIFKDSLGGALGSNMQGALIGIFIVDFFIVILFNILQIVSFLWTIPIYIVLLSGLSLWITKIFTRGIAID